MGQDHHDSHSHTNPHAVQEADSELPQRIRSIELIKHNPNLFHVGLGDVSKLFHIYGGFSTLACEFAGAAFGYWYFA